MIRFVTYSADNMTRSRMECVMSAQKNGADQVFEFGPENISNEFMRMNRDILEAERGAGYWLWKPYVIWRALQHCEDGDFLVYVDAGVKIIAPLTEITRVMDQDVFLFSNGHQHVHWCKADVMQSINGKQADVSLTQVQASAIFFRVNDFTRKFIKEWLLWCQMPGMIDDSPSVLPNHPEFAQHRYDQAILTSLAIKYSMRLHWWADHLWYESQRYRWPEDRYPSIFEHHRKRNDQW